MRPDFCYRARDVLPEFPAGACGVDEAGRGPLAGPVLAAALILPAGVELEGLRDSKLLSAPQRTRLAAEIKAVALSWAIGEVSAPEIDALNILQATLLAMQRALAKLTQAPTEVWVDGLHAPSFFRPSRAVVKGDQRVVSISAASILAKTARDAHMIRLADHYPGYGFEQHKGYASAAHRAALQHQGPCPEHRRSFAPVRALLP
ncbi:ribonuclease HII [Ferrovum sp.]|uniref:ribonuclease HII n=1 Tax=Ferrovum sp. TaxID=2609467 RepID=UPI00261B54E4|nr:ribonuclease HII [Ferrovum sp.]